MYAQNGNTKITLVVNSYGGPVSLYFLTGIVTQDWKDTYIHGYVTLAAAWNLGGSSIHSILAEQPMPTTNTSSEMEFEADTLEV